MTSAEVLRILLSISPTEAMHFQDKAGNAPPLTDPTIGLTFPDLNAGGELYEPTLIMPEPTKFLERKCRSPHLRRQRAEPAGSLGKVLVDSRRRTVDLFRTDSRARPPAPPRGHPYGAGHAGPRSGLTAAKLMTTAPGQVVSRPASKPGSGRIY